jgi:hypothetical protein
MARRISIGLLLGIGILAGWIPTSCAQAVEEFNAYLLPDTSVVAQGATFDVSFEVDASAHSFNGYEVRIHWNPRTLSLVSVHEGSLMTDFCPNRFTNLSQTDSTVTYTHVVLCNGLSLNGPGVLSRFTFIADSIGVSPLMIFSNPDQTFYDAGRYVNPNHPTYPRQVVLHDAVVVVADPTSGISSPHASDAGRLEIRITPNPATRSGAIRFGLARETPVRVEVLDVQGRLVWEWGEETAGPGAVDLEWQGIDRNGARVSSGIYFCRVRAGSESGVRTLVLTR